ncbi:hypothetical protein J6590_010520, partial [Homalodisca vitripennis]
SDPAVPSMLFPTQCFILFIGTLWPVCSALWPTGLTKLVSVTNTNVALQKSLIDPLTRVSDPAVPSMLFSTHCFILFIGTLWPVCSALWPTGLTKLISVTNTNVALQKALIDPLTRVSDPAVPSMLFSTHCFILFIGTLWPVCSALWPTGLTKLVSVTNTNVALQKSLIDPLTRVSDPAVPSMLFSTHCFILFIGTLWPVCSALWPTGLTKLVSVTNTNVALQKSLIDPLTRVSDPAVPSMLFSTQCFILFIGTLWPVCSALWPTGLTKLVSVTNTNVALQKALIDPLTRVSDPAVPSMLFSTQCFILFIGTLWPVCSALWPTGLTKLVSVTNTNVALQKSLIDPLTRVSHPAVPSMLFSTQCFILFIEAFFMSLHSIFTQYF